MRKIICVIGMHRSGTSVITRGVVALGAYPGEFLIPATEDNLKGHWEDSRIVELNTRILEYLGFNWFDYDHSVVDRFNQLLAMYQDQFLDRALSIISDLFSHSDCIVIKDPRMSILLPFWKTVFLKLETEAQYIYVFRNPLEVAKSMNVRDEIDIEDGLRVWQYYNARLLNDMNTGVLFVCFHHFLIKIDAEISRIADFCNLKESSKNLETFKNEFISYDLKHHNSSRRELTDIPDSKSQLILFDQCLEWSKKAVVPFAEIADFIESNRNDLFAALNNSLMPNKKKIQFQMFGKNEEGFSEQNSITHEVDVGYCDISLPLDEFASDEFRIDPAEVPCIFRLDSLSAYSEQASVHVNIKQDNSVYSNFGYYVFDTNDPQLQISIKGGKASSLRICGFILPVVSRLANVLACVKNKKIFDMETELKNKHQDMANLHQDMANLHQELTRAVSEKNKFMVLFENLEKIFADQTIHIGNLGKAFADQTQQLQDVVAFFRKEFEAKESELSRLLSLINGLGKTFADQTIHLENLGKAFADQTQQHQDVVALFTKELAAKESELFSLVSLINDLEKSRTEQSVSYQEVVGQQTQSLEAKESELSRLSPLINDLEKVVDQQTQALEAKESKLSRLFEQSAYYQEICDQHRQTLDARESELFLIYDSSFWKTTRLLRKIIWNGK